MNKKDKKSTIDRYNARIDNLGFTDKALGWTRENNHVRFKALMSLWTEDLNGSSIFDFGCGLGDFCGYLKKEIYTPFKYHGLDINPTLVKEAQDRHPDYSFSTGDLFDYNVEDQFDFSFSSGVFNHKLNHTEEYDFIFSCIQKLFHMSSKGVAINFLSDKVDYFTEHNFNSDPSKILNFAYRLTNNVSLLNNYMPFEFTVFLRKDKIIDKNLLIFSS